MWEAIMPVTPEPFGQRACALALSCAESVARSQRLPSLGPIGHSVDEATGDDECRRPCVPLERCGGLLTAPADESAGMGQVKLMAVVMEVVPVRRMWLHRSVVLPFASKVEAEVAAVAVASNPAGAGAAAAEGDREPVPDNSERSASRAVSQNSENCSS